MSDADLTGKFRRLAVEAVGEASTESALQMINGLEEVACVADLGRLLAG